MPTENSAATEQSLTPQAIATHPAEKYLPTNTKTASASTAEKAIPNMHPSKTDSTCSVMQARSTGSPAWSTSSAKQTGMHDFPTTSTWPNTADWLNPSATQHTPIADTSTANSTASANCTSTQHQTMPASSAVAAMEPSSKTSCSTKPAPSAQQANV